LADRALLADGEAAGMSGRNRVEDRRGRDAGQEERAEIAFRGETSKVFTLVPP